MLKNAAHTNPDCKKAAYEYYKAVYKWIGDALLPQIEDKLKKAQIDDLKKLFEAVKAEGSKEKRLTRKERKVADAKKDEEQEEQDDQAAADLMAEQAKAEEEVIDPLEFAPVKDVLAGIPPEWYEELPKLKWSEKVAKFEEIAANCQNAKIKPGNFGMLAAVLNKEIRGTNVNIATGGIKLATALALGLKQDFATPCKELIEGVLLKFKEKRPAVQEACTKFCEAAIACCTLGDVSEQVIPCITNVAPGVKTGTLKFVEKAVVVTYVDVLERAADEYLPAIAKVMEDKDGGVRDTALHCMGLLKGRLKDAIIGKFIKALNAQKTAKLEEAATEIQASKYDKPENWKPPPPKKKKPVKVEVDEDAEMDDDAPPKKAPPKNIGKRPAKKKPAAAAEQEEAKESAPARSAPAKKAAGSAKGPTAPVVDDENVGEGISADAAAAMVEESVGAGVISSFGSAKWQEKVAGFEALQAHIRDNEPSHELLEAIAKFIKTKMKDFKESNVNLLKGTVATYDLMARETQALGKRAMAPAMHFFVDKIGDVKLSAAIKEMLLCAAELVTPKFIALQIIKYAASAKAPNTIKESCNFLT